MTRATVKTLFANPQDFDKKQAKVCGWVKTLRHSGAIVFIELNDGSCFNNLQIVVSENNIENFEAVTKLNVGSALIIHGEVILTPAAKQPLEISATNIEVEGASTPDYPLQKKRHTLEYLRTIPHLRPRTNTLGAVFRVRSVAAYAIHKFFNERGFVYSHSPIITGSDAEGAGEMFRVTTLSPTNPPLTESGEVDYTEDFFGKETNLTVSGQLQAEIMALTYANVYTFAPTFRAENSYTARHASEFWMIEPEIAFADLNDDMELAEDMTKFVIAHVLKECPEEMEFFDKFIEKGITERLTKLVNAKFARMTYTEAIDILLKVKDRFSFPVEWGCDLQTEHERYICEEHVGGPVFVTDYPKDIKAFYMRLNDDNKTVAAMDMLVPGVGELIGGSQREERYDILAMRMDEVGIDKEHMQWYLDLRKYGGTKHAGYGLGFERLIMYITGVSNIRDVIPFPRTPKTADL